MSISFLVALFLFPNPVDDSKKEPPKTEPAYVAEVKAIQKLTKAELDRFYKDFESKYETASTKEQESLRLQAAEKSKAILTPALVKTLELVRPNAQKAEAVDGLIWIVERSYSNLKFQVQVVELLQKYHLVHPKVIELTYSNKQTGLAWVSKFLRAQLESPYLPSEQRYRVLAALAVSLQKQASIPAMDAEFPEFALKRRKQNEQTEEVAEMMNVDVQKLEDEAVERFTELKEKYATKELRGGVVCGPLATSSIFEIRHMKVWKPAPELAGEDLDGVAFKLSDYRGKVVMISFWATWCGPCMALVPHEKEIVETFKNRPFALIGVNSDPFKKTALKTVEKEKINWRSFWCGEKGPNADLPLSWNVTGWPTVYVIDHEGIIRVKHGTHVGTALDKRIDELVKIVESKSKK